MRRYNFLLQTATLIFIFSFFCLHSYLNLDPDFGWHLKTGKLIVHQGIPKIDPFSYSMPSFPLVSHDWLSSVVTFVLYQNIGLLGLSVIFSFLAISSLLIAVPRGIFKWVFVPLLLGLLVVLPFVSIRPQEISWFFFALLIRITWDVNLWNRYRLFVPAVFLLWTNLHGAYASGLALITLYFIYLSIKQKRIDLLNLAILVFSFLVTLINPYGIRLWNESLIHITDTTLHSTILEWFPLWTRFDFAIALLFSLSALFISKFWRKLTAFHLVLYFSLLISGVLTQRNIVLWVLIAVPLLAQCLELFYREVWKDKEAEKRFNISYKYLVGIALIVAAVQTFSIIKSLPDITEEKSYPKSAISFLRKQDLKGEIFSPYNWGGYLIWKLPEKKVFIDGRMPTWRWDKNPKNESSWVLQESKDLISGKSKFNQAAKKYNITYVLWPKIKSNKAPKNITIPFINFTINNPNQTEGFLERLKKEGWEKIYEDDVAVIYKKADMST